jgi:NAD(P)-dependent dehydrogenase (short-subunit alcohol dehydrogenase family)
MVKDIFSVVGKTAIVTGASSGLGEESAQILASRGANVVLAARRKGLLTDEEMPAVLRLRELRNQAAHSVDPDITITDALRYHDIADTLIQKIKERQRR